MKITKLYKNEELFPLEKGTKNHLFINPVAAELLTIKKKLDNTGVDVKDVVSEFTYSDGTTPLTKSLKEIISKSVVSDAQFKYSRVFNERQAEEEYKKTFKFVDIWEKMNQKYINRDDYNLSFQLYNSTNLYNSTLAGEHPSKRATLPYKIGKYFRLKKFEQKFSVTDEEIKDNLYNPDFMTDIMEEKLIDWANQMNEVVTVGEYDSSYSIGNPATGLADGLETQIVEEDGTYNNRDNETADPKMGRKYIKPNAIDIDKVVGSDKNMADLTGSDIYDIFDEMLRLKNTNKYIKTSMKRANDLSFYLTPTMYDKYMGYRGEPVSSTTPNTLQESYRQNGGTFRHKGYPVAELVDLSGDYILFGSMKEFFGINSKLMREVREYEPELVGGGSGFTWYRKGWTVPALRDGSKFIYAGDNLACSDPIVLNEYTINGKDVTGDTLTAAPDWADANDDVTVYPVSTCLGATMYYTTDGTTPDATDTAIEEGSGIKLEDGSDTTLKVIAIKSDTLESSSVVTFQYDMN